jgi:hypothetical protein
MTDVGFNAQDLELIRIRGMTVEQLNSQVALFKRGIPPVQLLRPCTVNDGITVLPESESARLCAVYSPAVAAGRAMKFVPASGAASRMFEVLHVFDPTVSPAEVAKQLADTAREQPFRQFVNSLQDFAFYDDLRAAMARDGLDVQTLVSQRDYQTVVEYLLTPKGLNYARLPKGLIKFHRYPDRARTPFEEHLVEAVAYTLDHDRRARVHFTVSPEHEELVTHHIAHAQREYERSGIQVAVSFSTQKPSTDTIAVDGDNRPVRDQEGALVFRPGGHGALLENLNDLHGDIVFIKNIDNVVPEKLTPLVFLYKKALGGLLVELQNEIFGYLEALSSSQSDERLLKRGFEFLRDKLSVSLSPGVVQGTRLERIRFLFARLHRPLRVCGVVKNRGEPGGGPFWVAHASGDVSLQIVESAQVNLASSQQRAVWESATHFNPVDLVCGVRDYRGNPFDLHAFADPLAGLITVKSKEGKQLKALELPGLWNGAMAHWNTVFVEVPLATFNPVKTVLDLLRKEHRAE